jgi:hypothetical protein
MKPRRLDVVVLSVTLMLALLNFHAAAQAMGCSKCCGGSGSAYADIGHRDCSGLGAAACHVTDCDTHVECDGNCPFGQSDTYNDLCGYHELEWECESVQFHWCNG